MALEDVRKSVGAAFDRVTGGEGADGAASAEPPKPAEAEPPKPAEAKPATKAEGEKPAVKAEGEKPAAKTEGEKPAAKAEGEKPAAKAEGEKPAAKAEGEKPWEKAPRAWTASAREDWEKLPPAVKEEVHRREREMGIRLQQASDRLTGAAESLRSHGEWEAALRPYEGLAAQSGMDVRAATLGLLQTAAMLESPRTSSAQRADWIARTVATYGVTVKDLAQALERAGFAADGKQPAPQSPTAAGGFDPRVDALLAEREQAEQSRRQAEQQRTEALVSSTERSVAEWSKGKEFYDDVRGHMADLLETYARQGKRFESMDQLYDMAIETYPATRDVARKRRQVAEESERVKAAERARAASASVRDERNGSSAVHAAANEPKSVKDSVRAAAAKHGL